jgi:uncharacterized phage protein gp47/JayE
MNLFSCCDQARRDAVVTHPVLNGIDFLEVSPDQTRLTVRFLKPVAAGVLTPVNAVIVGGDRVRNIRVLSLDAVAPDTVRIQVSEPGDASRYQLRLRASEINPQPPGDFDPILSTIEFSFKVLCENEFDCRPTHSCEQAAAEAPEIDYLAKDYASIRQAMLDRIATLAPGWRGRYSADLGVTLVELLAYLADRLSYQQDSVSTEAYVGTARRRTSVRRHARLVDYRMHDGASARAWVQIAVRDDIAGLVLAPPARFLTRLPGAPAVVSELGQALSEGAEVFELMASVTLNGAHNRMRFHTWGDRECCLAPGATRATLLGSFPALVPGDVLILAEQLGPLTGLPADADRAHRHAVRLTSVTPGLDPLGNVGITEVAWSGDDALPFALCISSRSGTAYFADVSVALGNIALADHGLTLAPEALPPVPAANPNLAPAPDVRSHCESALPASAPPRYRPRLARGPLSQVAPYDALAPASAALRHSAAGTSPAIILAEGAVTWHPRRDLLGGGARREFAAEVEEGGVATLRFGDGELGERPVAGARFMATYRVGMGRRGNLGANVLAHISTRDPAIDADPALVLAVTNPLPAQGGADAESIEEVLRDAPGLFQTQERAVTLADYADTARRVQPGVQRAAATRRWTGSWSTIFLTIDRLNGLAPDAAFRDDLRARLERYRLAGHDLAVDEPRFVPLEIAMQVCVRPGYFRSEVKAALLDIFSRRGLFHPDNFTFGQPVYLSPLYAAAQAVAGVASVDVTAFERRGQPSPQGLLSGKLLFGRLEIARLDNDASQPERGVLRLTMGGGQ